MAETYSIQATLTAKDELSPVLDQIAKIVAKLQDVFHDLAGSKIFDAIVNDANKAINAFGRVKSAADKLGTSLGSLGGAKSGRQFGRAGRQRLQRDSGVRAGRAHRLGNRRQGKRPGTGCDGDPGDRHGGA